jgi:hypothetical protein
MAIASASAAAEAEPFQTPSNPFKSGTRISARRFAELLYLPEAFPSQAE